MCFAPSFLCSGGGAVTRISESKHRRRAPRVHGAEKLVFESCEWGDDEVERLAAVLHLATRVSYLSLGSNPRIGARGLGALAARLREGAAPKLREIELTQWEGRAAAELRVACEGRGIKLGAFVD